MKKTLLSLMIVVGLAAGARAEDSRPQLDQDVVRSSITMSAIVIGTAFVAVEASKMAGSFFVEVQNLSVEQVCCAFDASASAASAAGKACVRIDTASTAARATSSDWKRWKRWAQNLSLYCRSLKGSGGTAEIVVTQGK